METGWPKEYYTSVVIVLIPTLLYQQDTLYKDADIARLALSIDLSVVM